MSSGCTGLTTTRVPGGIFGVIEPVSMTYGVAPARRGMTSATSRAATTDSITSQDRTSPAQRSGAGIQELCVTAGAPLQTRVVELRSGVLLLRGDGDVVERGHQVLGGVAGGTVEGDLDRHAQLLAVVGPGDLGDGRPVHREVGDGGGQAATGV